MRSRLRSVSVATLACVLSISVGATAEESRPGATTTPAAPAATTSAPAASAGRKAEPLVDDERLSDEAELARVVNLVEAARYEECVARVSRLLDPKAPRPLRQPEIIETVRIYHATCLIGLGKTEAADAPLRDAVRKNPQMRAPDSLIFPPKVIDRFIKVREELYDELRKAERETIERARREAAAKQKQENDRWARMLFLERLARQEVVVQQNSRWVAAIPFGVGQFQNDNKAVGWLFLGSEVALGATAIVSAAVYTHIQAQADTYQRQGRGPDADINQRLDTWYNVLLWTSYGFFGVAALGIAEAQISYVPEVRRIRERPLPKPPSEGLTLRWEPTVALGPGDYRLGVRGSF